MEQKARGPADGRSKLVDAMGWMRRSGMLYVILLALMASCKSCVCESCKKKVNEYFCNQWVKQHGCTTVCQVRYQLIDQNGNNLTNVTSSSQMPLQISNANNSSEIFFSSVVTFDANGSSGVLPLKDNRCIDPCVYDLAGNPFSFSAAGIIKTNDPTCDPGKCRYWGVSSNSSDIGFGFEGCVVVVKIRLVPMQSCLPC